MNTLSKSDKTLLLFVMLAALLAPFILNPFPAESAMAQFNAGYPDLMQRFAIYGILVIGFNILFGLTGYLSFGHAAFLGVGSYSAVWMMKLLTMNIIPGLILSVVVAGLFSLLIGYISLRRSGIYFSILTLAFAQMSYSLAYSVLTPITNGETGLQIRLKDARIFDAANTTGNLPVTNFFGLEIRNTFTWDIAGWVFHFNVGYYICVVFLILAFYLSIRIFRSPFGLMLRAIKTNQARLNYTGLNARPYTLAAFVISGMYAGLAGGLLAAMDPLAGAERMQWTASGEIVLMTILGGTGTLIGPILGGIFIKYLENIFSKINDHVLHSWFSFLPDNLGDATVWVLHFFVGKGWHLTLGLLFMLIVTFLPGGLMEGWGRILSKIRKNKDGDSSPDATSTTTPAE